MNYLHEVNQVTEVLQNVAERGFLSDPVKMYNWSDIMGQKAIFTAEENFKIRTFLATYGRVLSKVDYPLASFLSEEKSRTASLLTMFSCMLNDSGPEYVLENLKRLEDATETHKEAFISLDFQKEMRNA